MDIGVIVKNISIYALPVGMSIILHEVAHGWVAEKFGDTTARRAGRITINPISHIDLIGTVILPIIQIVTLGRFFLGWAKPVPVNFAALRNPKKDMVWVSIAGPGTNFCLALGSALLLRVILLIEPNASTLANRDMPPEMLRDIGVGVSVLVPIVLMLCASILANSALMVLNMIPVPPLDGGRVAVGLLPRKAAYAYSKVESMGLFILIMLIFVIPQTRVLFSLVIYVFVTLFSLAAGVDAYSVLFK